MSKSIILTTKSIDSDQAGNVTHVTDDVGVD